MRRRINDPKEAKPTPEKVFKTKYQPPKVVNNYEPHNGVMKILEEGHLHRTREFFSGLVDSVDRHSGFVVK